MANNQYLPSLNFQPYVKPYVGIPLKEISEASSDLRNQYDANLTSADAIDLAMRQVKTLKGDSPIKQQLIDKVKNTLSEVAKSGGRWEFASAKVRELAKDVRGDEDLQAIMQSYQNSQEEDKLFQQLNAQGKAIRFKPSDNHTTIMRNPDGTVVRNIYTPDTQQKLDYRPKQESYFDGIRELSNQTRTKTLAETTDANGNIISIDKLTQYEGISKSRIIAQAKKSLGSYLESNEGHQQFRVLTELGENGEPPLSPIEAKNRILSEMITAGMERAGVSSKESFVEGAVKNRGGGSGGAGGGANNPNSALMPITLKKSASDYKSLSDVDKKTKDLENTEEEIVNNLTQDFIKKNVKGVEITEPLLRALKSKAREAINGESKYAEWNNLAKNYAEPLANIKDAKEIENQRKVDASNYAFSRDVTSASKVLEVEKELNKMGIVEDKYGETYTANEIYNLLNSKDGKRLIKDGYNNYSFQHKGNFTGKSDAWVTTHSISGSDIKPILKLIEDNKESIEKYNNLKNNYIKDISAKSLSTMAETIMPGSTKQEQTDNTKLVTEYFSKKSNLIKTAGDIIATSSNDGEIEQNQNLIKILEGIKGDDVKLGTVGLDLYNPSGVRTYVMTIDTGDKSYEINIPYNNYPVSGIDKVLDNNPNDAASYGALRIIESNKSKGVSLVPIRGLGKLKYDVQSGKFEGLLGDDGRLHDPKLSQAILEKHLLDINNGK